MSVEAESGDTLAICCAALLQGRSLIMTMTAGVANEKSCHITAVSVIIYHLLRKCNDDYEAARFAIAGSSGRQAPTGRVYLSALQPILRANLRYAMLRSRST